MSAGGRRRGGFTLLELLVVMVLLGLLASMAVPQMQRWHDAVQARAQAVALVDEVRLAVFAAGARRLSVRLDRRSFAATGDEKTEPAQPLLRLKLPVGWSLLDVRPATLLASGLCDAGEIQLLTDRGLRVALRIGGPRCAVSLDAVAKEAP